MTGDQLGPHVVSDRTRRARLCTFRTTMSDGSEPSHAEQTLDLIEVVRDRGNDDKPAQEPAGRQRRDRARRLVLVTGDHAISPATTQTWLIQVIRRRCGE